jgi:hypothetical protein
MADKCQSRFVHFGHRPFVVMQDGLINSQRGDTMTPYVSYQMYWAARPLTPHEQRATDEQIGRLSASVSGTVARFRRPRRTSVRPVRYRAAQSATGR